MALSTNLNTSPYYDDFDSSKNYSKILFKPGAPPQVREFNQLQSILQDQISKFGDNILKQGTIIDGCEVSLHSMFPFVKLKDTDTSGIPINVSSFENLVVQSSSGLKALVVKSAQGFESRNPDLNTLFVRYINSGSNNNTYQFLANEVLTVFDQQQRIFSVSVNNGSAGFANNDILTFVPALSVVNSTAGFTFGSGFYVGDGLSDGAGIYLVITGVNTTSNGTILSVRPQYSNIVAGTTASWTVPANTTLVDANTGQTAIVSSVLGSKAAGIVTTDSVGRVASVSMSVTGAGYDPAPYTTLVSKTATLSQIQALNLLARNYIAQVTVSNTISIPVGYGYAATIDQGTIYQKGYFSHVANQLVIVSKYSNTPSDISVGFDTSEKIITSNIDPTLLDPTTGNSQNAPGADRLQLIPTGVAISKTAAEANTNFLSLVEFSEGEAFKLDPITQYNIINDVMAIRMNDAEGNFVTDRFQLATKSANLAQENASFKYIIDPGSGYINGNKVQTVRNYVGTIAKGTDTVAVPTSAISVDYGNYIIVTNASGFIYKLEGQIISLSSAALSIPAAGAAPADPGSQIGQARVRAVTLHSAGAVRQYRIYLFDIAMNSGKNFTSVLSIYSATAAAGAQMVLTSGKTIMQDPGKISGLFPSGQRAIKSINNVTYTIRDISSQIVNTDGTIAKTLTGGRTFLYTGSLSTSALLDIGLVLTANTQSSANLSGSAVVTSGSNVVTGTTTTFNTEVSAGSYIKVANTTANVVVQVSSITNATSLVLTGNAPSSITGNVISFFPANVPLPVSNASVSGATMTITLPYPVVTGANASISALANEVNPAIASKTVVRQQAIRIDASNNVTTNIGPWAIGVPDVIRLRSVLLGANNTFVAGDAGVSDVTASFYIDHNQQPDLLNTSYLYKKPRGAAAVPSNGKMLVVFDVLTTSSNGLRTLGSYPVNDTANLASLTTQMNTLEIPEVFKGSLYFDLRDQFDFRPIVANTITLTSNVASAPINPTEPVYGSRFASAFVFPAPKTTMTANVVYYQGRSDRIVITEKNRFAIITGIPGNYKTPKEPANVITINNLVIPPYPTLPQSLSADMALIADTNIANETYTTRRLNDFRVRTTLTSRQITDGQPRGYKMSDIGKIDRRLTNVEDFLAFTAAEAATKNRTIGSSTTGLDVFKFGFVVDTFLDDSLADVDNPDYHATIRNGWLLPKDDALTIEFRPEQGTASSGNTVTVPWIPAPIVNQGNASHDDDDCSLTTDILNPVQAIIKFKGRHHNALWDSIGNAREETTFTFSGKQGPAEAYFAFYHAKNGINIYQSTDAAFTNPILVKSAQNAVAASGTDLTKVPEDLPFGTFVSHGQLGSGALAAYAVSGSGKITWTHSPANGIFYKIVVSKFGGTTDRDAPDFYGRWSFALLYPTDADGEDDCEPNRTEHLIYTGRFTRLSPEKFRPSAVDAMLIKRVGAPYYYESQMFEMKVTGLKPFTQHMFILENKDLTLKCAPRGGKVGDILVTDQKGKLEFDFYFDADLSVPTSDFTLINKMSGSVAGPKTIHVISADGSSGAEGQIIGKPYITLIPVTASPPVITTPTPTPDSTTVTAPTTVTVSGSGADSSLVPALFKADLIRSL